MKCPWIDTHIHVSDIGPDGKRRESLIEDLLAVLDRCDANLRLILSCDDPYISAMAGDAEQMLVGNRMIHELVRCAPGRLYGSCMINPNFPDESLRVMDKCFGEWGFVQLGEMLTYCMNYRMDSDVGIRVVRRSVDYGVPVQVHLGTYWHRDAGPSGAGMDHMADLLRISECVPEADYILAHAIGCGPTSDYVPWADMFLDTLAGVFPVYPRNFWIEIRDFHCPALKRTLAAIPSDRLLAGTDWTSRVGPPFQSYGTMFEVRESENPYPPAVASMAEFLHSAGASDDEVWRIGYENARELLKL